MIWCQQDQLMDSQHKLRVQLLRLVQMEHIHLQQQLRVHTRIQFQYVRRVKQQIARPKL